LKKVIRVSESSERGEKVETARKVRKTVRRCE
jgi:hypothetical protein